jgi:ribosomal protein S18 acetylase RimI-like enzyme
MDFKIEDVIISEANQTDMDTLLEFEQAVINTERPFDPTIKSETTYYDLNAMLDNDNVKLLVAEWNNKIIGCGYARIEKSKQFRKHSHHAYLGFMFVLPEFRGKTVNTRIMESLKEWAKNKGAAELRLEVYFDNINAIKAYEKFGFSKQSIEMRCDI